MASEVYVDEIISTTVSSFTISNIPTSKHLILYVSRSGDSNLQVGFNHNGQEASGYYWNGIYTNGSDGGNFGGGRDQFEPSGEGATFYGNGSPSEPQQLRAVIPYSFGASGNFGIRPILLGHSNRHADDLFQTTIAAAIGEDQVGTNPINQIAVRGGLEAGDRVTLVIVEPV